MPDPRTPSPADLIGPAEHLVRSLARVPRSARWLLPVLAAAFRGTAESSIDPRVRTLVLLRVAALERSPYWRVQLEALAERAGITADEITLVESDEWETAPVFSERDLAAIRWADRVGKRLARRDRTAHQQVTEHFGEAEVVELTMVAALGELATRFTNALRIEPDRADALASAPAELDRSLERWASAMFDLDLAAVAEAGAADDGRDGRG